MPLYLFQNDNGEIKEVIQKMADPHIYEEGGVKWTRIFVNPQVSIDTRIDPFSQKQFSDAMGKKRGGTIGNLLDESTIASEKRAKICGSDPIRNKVIDDYERKTHKKHPSKIPKSVEIDLFKKEVKAIN